MLAFYAWTDTLIFNMCNTKVTYFFTEKASLFILKMPRVSLDLIYSVKKHRIFDEVFEVELPSFELVKGSPLSLKEKINKLLSARRMRNYYFGELRKHVSNKKYTKLFTGAFWANTLFVYQYLSKSNPTLSIELVEEGLANYNSPFGWEFKCLPTRKKTELLMRYVYFFNVWKSAKAKTTRKYIYHPEFTRSACCLDVLPLPQINDGICLDILETAGESIDMKEYRIRNVHFFPGLELHERHLVQFREVLMSVQRVVSDKDILMKIHPVFKKADTNVNPDVYIDKRNYFFEAAACKLNMEEKIIIVLHTTLPLMIKNITQSEPIIIFTYKLYNFENEFEVAECEVFVADIKRHYSQPSKIYAPDTLEELNAVIKSHMKVKND